MRTIEYMVCCIRPEEMAEMLAKYPDAVSVPTGVPTCWSDGGQLFPSPAVGLSMRCWVQRRCRLDTLPDPIFGFRSRMSREPYPVENPLGAHDMIVEVYATREIPDAAPETFMSSMREIAREG